MSGAETTNMTATDAVIENRSNFGTGSRCLPFHLWKAELVLVDRNPLKIGGTMASKPRHFVCGFLINPSSRLTTDELLSLDVTETRSGLIMRNLRESLWTLGLLSCCADGKDMDWSGAITKFFNRQRVGAEHRLTWDDKKRLETRTDVKFRGALDGRLIHFKKGYYIRHPLSSAKGNTVGRCSRQYERRILSTREGHLRHQ